MVAGLEELCIVGAGVEVERRLYLVIEADAVENGAEGFSFVGARGRVLARARESSAIDLRRGRIQPLRTKWHQCEMHSLNKAGSN